MQTALPYLCFRPYTCTMTLYHDYLTRIMRTINISDFATLELTF